jgi:hypothetical protein
MNWSFQGSDPGSGKTCSSSKVLYQVWVPPSGYPIGTRGSYHTFGNVSLKTPLLNGIPTN